MTKVKKLKRNDPKVGDALINKALEKYNTSVEEINKKYSDGMIEGVLWCQYYTFDSKEEYESWMNWCKEFLQTKVTPKVTNNEFEKMWCWFNLKVGLRQNYEVY